MEAERADQIAPSSNPGLIAKNTKAENTGKIRNEIQQPEKSTFKKGHRRAHSMPSNAQKADKTMANGKEQTIGEKQPEHKRRVMRHRHIRLKPNILNSSAAANASKKRHPQPNFDTIEVLEEEHEFEVPINEEEMMRFPGMEEGSQKSDKISVHRRFWQLNWKGVHFSGLPTWLQDNEFLHFGHRPPLPSFGSCFKSIFSLHTETGNILTHMYGAIAFIGIFIWFLVQAEDVVSWPDKLIFSSFFVGAILCMGMSFAFHTVQCHSEDIGRLFSKLDYAGISLLIIGSFVPWLYYAFFCRVLPMTIYISMIFLLGIAALVVSLFDKFSQPKYRPLRAIVFMAMGLSSELFTLFYIHFPLFFFMRCSRSSSFGH
ncbi:hypothetical protein niasHT_007822 [Heterodera trifolii]|uniref:Uncharacterized protein n=1 Tax=Heterodera trifolii TaxID=157864 RepID=A0ABD2LZ42_9BILA